MFLLASMQFLLVRVYDCQVVIMQEIMCQIISRPVRVLSLIKVIKDKLCYYRPPSLLQFGAGDLGIIFLGSGGEPTKEVGLD